MEVVVAGGGGSGSTMYNLTTPFAHASSQLDHQVPFPKPGTAPFADNLSLLLILS